MANDEFDLDWDNDGVGADGDGAERKGRHPAGAVTLSPAMRFGIRAAALAGLAVIGYVGVVEVPNVMHGGQQVMAIDDSTCCWPGP